MSPDERAKQLGNNLMSCDGMNEEYRIEAGEHLLRLVEENGRMRRGLEQIVSDSDTRTAVMLGVQIVGRIHRTAVESLTPTPAVETKARCGRCGDTGKVPVFEGSDREIEIDCPDHDGGGA